MLFELKVRLSIFFTLILFYMKKFEAIGVTCKTDITASKKLSFFKTKNLFKNIH